MKVYSIYKITNTTNNKSYIGFTSQNPPETRWTKHLWCAKKNYGFKYYLHRSILKYGKKNFNFEIIYQSKNKKHCLNEMESYFIEKHHTLSPNGYNLTTGGEGGVISKETKKKHSGDMKRIWRNKQYRKNIIDGLKKACNDPTYIKQRSKLTKDMWKDPEFRKKVDKTFKDPLYRKMLSDNSKKLWKDPEFRKRGTEVMCRFLYEVTFPDGHIETTINIKQFCREHNLFDTAAYQVMKGKVSHHYGFKFKKIGAR